jgi:hypothetical protein
LVPHFAGSAGSGATLINIAPKGHQYAYSMASPISRTPIANLQDVAKVTPMANPLSHPLLKAMHVPTGATALTVRAITRQMINNACFGATDSIEIGSMRNMRRYVLADARVPIDLTLHLFMSSTNSESWADSGLRDMISFLSFNVNKNYLYTETLLVHLSIQRKVDVIFLQEPPWRTIRHAPSASNLEGEEVVGPPLHQNWNVIYHKPDHLGNPRTMCYVHKRLIKFRSSYCREIIDHRDLLLLSLQVGGSEIFALNIYNDDRATAVSFLRREGLVIPCLSIMTGDFNCHSIVWDPSYNSHRAAAAHLLELTQDLELDWDPPANPGPTYVPHVKTLNHMVIDLIFLVCSISSEVGQSWQSAQICH